MLPPDPRLSKLLEQPLSLERAKEIADKIYPRPSANGNGHATNGKPAADSGPRLAASMAANLETKSVDWLWRPYIPAGAVTLIDGDPGRGKSQVTIDLAARVSRGWSMPPHAGGKQVCEPAAVLLLSAEDDPCRVIRPRLAAAGADLKRVIVIDGVNGEKFSRPVSLPEDLELIGRAATEAAAALVVIDPFSAFLTGAVDSHKDSDVRRVMHELRRLAEAAGVAIIIVRHLNKLVSVSSALHRGGGSIAIAAASRSVMVIGKHPDDERACVLCGVKNNFAPLPPSLGFAIEPVGDVSRVGWTGEVDVTADQAIEHGRPVGRPSEATAEAEAFLRQTLAAGPVPVAEVKAKAEADGIAWRTLERAKRTLKVEAFKGGFAASSWAWRLPAEGRQTAEDRQNSPDNVVLAAFEENRQKTPEITEGRQNSVGRGILASFEGGLPSAGPYAERR
jgi:hypothetical protein